VAVVQRPTSASDAAGQEPEKKATIAKLDPTLVPAGKTYALLDEKGKTTKRFRAGTKTSMTVDCVQVPCPDTFEKGVVCWKCKERLKAKE
jgi:hypothetical protein